MPRPLLRPAALLTTLIAWSACVVADVSQVDKFECDAGVCAGDGPPPESESCAQSVPLPSVGVVAVTGTTRGRKDDGRGGCGGAGPDAVYTLRVGPAPVTLSATLATGEAAQGVLYLRGPGPDSCPTAPEGACTTAVRGVAELRDVTLDAGTWALWVDNAGPTGDAFDLTVALDGAKVPGDTCANPIALGSLGAGTLTSKGTTVGAAADSEAACANTSAPDVVYSFVVPRDGRLTAVVTPGLSTALPVLYLRQACDGDPDAGTCAPAPAQGQPARLSSVRVTPGTWYLWVDGPGSSNISGHSLAVTFE